MKHKIEFSLGEYNLLSHALKTSVTKSETIGKHAFSFKISTILTTMDLNLKLGQKLTSSNKTTVKITLNLAQIAALHAVLLSWSPSQSVYNEFLQYYNSLITQIDPIIVNLMTTSQAY